VDLAHLRDVKMEAFSLRCYGDAILSLPCTTNVSTMVLGRTRADLRGVRACLIHCLRAIIKWLDVEGRDCGFATGVSQSAPSELPRNPEAYWRYVGDCGFLSWSIFSHFCRIGLGECLLLDNEAQAFEPGFKYK
jgi:hypothetical protein